MKQFVAIIGFLCIPSFCTAAVVINEVAWMGSTASANHEWIELFNAGTAIDVTGWRLSDGANLSINLTGIISADSYAVLERTSDASAGGNAFLLYTGALSNGGSTLTLRNENGSVVDQVVGGEGWVNIGGDNTAKETAQRTGNSWVTAVATPGRETTGTQSVESEAAVSSETVFNPQRVVTAERSSEKPRLGEVENELGLTIVAPETAYVNQSISLAVIPGGIGRTLTNSLQYEWSFGDGASSSGKDTNHSFAYPGTYVITVYAEVVSIESMQRYEITILPLTLELALDEQGNIQIINTADYELDVSGFSLLGQEAFVFPNRTIILAGQKITLPQGRINPSNDIVLYDSVSEVVASLSLTQSIQPEIKTTATAKPQPAVNQQLKPKVSDANQRFGFAGVQYEHKEKSVSVAQATSQTAVLLASDTESSSNPWPYVGLIALIGFAVISLLIKPPRNQIG